MKYDNIQFFVFSWSKDDNFCIWNNQITIFQYKSATFNNIYKINKINLYIMIKKKGKQEQSNYFLKGIQFKELQKIF